jgi:putative transcriptional regulator
MSHVIALLPDRALDALEPSARERVEAHLAACPSCAAEARAWDETVVALAETLPPLEPSPAIRARVLAAAEAKGRLASFADAVVRLFQVPKEKALALLDAVDAADAWEPGPVPGLALMHLKGGPALAAADTGFVRFPAGMPWPLHKHLGDELMLIVEGGFVDDRGQAFGPGDVLRMPPGSQHAFDIGPDRDCVAAVVVHEGIELPPGHRLVI